MFNRLSYSSFLWLLRFVLCPLFFRFKRFGPQPPVKEGVLLLSNHQSFLDPVLVGTGIYRHIRFLARHTLWKQRFFGWIISTLGAVPVQREGADRDAIRGVVEMLKNGQAVLMFPEGTRTHDGDFGDIKRGFVLVARQAGVPIVPVCIDGSFKAWPRGKKCFRPHPVRVAYGEPIRPPSGTDEQSPEAAMKEHYQRLPDLLLEQWKVLREACRGTQCSPACDNKNS